MSESRSIPSLDGIRALAIMAVILGHSESKLLAPGWLQPFRNGSLGVIGFFVLSGFLITGILLREIDRTDTIRLKRFYARRSFRIFPAFYVYLAVITVLGFYRLVSLDLVSWLGAATYTWNYVLATKSFSLAHTWSLSLEEQFYLLWPLCLVAFRKRTCLWIAIASILVSPFSRVLTYFLLPAYRGHIGMMLHTHIDAILIGAGIALAQNLGMFDKLMSHVSKARWVIPVAVYFSLRPIILTKLRGAFSITVGATMDELSWAIILLHVTRFPRDILGRFLNWSVIVHIGRISYSLYLWQQLFTGENQHFSPFPLSVVWIFLCAEGSYWLIEQPFLRLRDRIVPTTAASSPLNTPSEAVTSN
jgi:peptidoglycan/LPS O-acetylase OafA/YrhL